MITLAMVSETIREFQEQGRQASAAARGAYNLYVRGGEAVVYEVDCRELQKRQEELFALATAWLDVIRGCRTEREFQARVEDEANYEKYRLDKAAWEADQ